MNEQSAEILPFLRPKLQTGGGEPPGSGQWLLKMSKGTRFLARRKNSNGSEVDDFIVCTDPKMMPVVLLSKNGYGRDGEVVWHDPKLFVRDYQFYTILEILDTENGNSDKVHTGPVAGDGKRQVISELDEKK